MLCRDFETTSTNRVIVVVTEGVMHMRRKYEK